MTGVQTCALPIFFEFDIVSYKPVSPVKFDEVLERLIPVDVRPYVWFQGERGISNLIDTSNNGSLRNVIKLLSDIERWDRYIQVTAKAYDTVKRDFDQKMSKSQKGRQEIEQLQTESRLLDDKIDHVEQQITTATQNHQAAEEKKNDLLASIEFAQKINQSTQSRDQARTAHEAATKQQIGRAHV